MDAMYRANETESQTADRDSVWEPQNRGDGVGDRDQKDDKNAEDAVSASPAAAAFARSLPPSYRDRYSRAAITAHAELSSQRSEETFSIGVFDDDEGGHPVALVTDDRPDVLALTSSALTSQGYSIGDAQFYTRECEDGTREALAVFWPQTAHGELAHLNPDDVGRLSQRLKTLLSGPPGELPEALSERSERQTNLDTRVRFVEGGGGSLSVLEVETDDRTGLLLSLARALFSANVQIVRSEVRTKGERVFDRFTVTERDGTDVSPARRLEIQVAVLGGLDR